MFLFERVGMRRPPYMNGPYRRRHRQPPATIAEALGQVEIFPIEEELGIESPDRVESIAPDQEHDRREGCDVVWPRRGTREQAEAPSDTEQGAAPRQLAEAQETRPEMERADRLPRASLIERPVALPDGALKRCDVRLFGHPRQSRRDGLGHYNGVGVAQKNERSPGARQPIVLSSAEPRVQVVQHDGRTECFGLLPGTVGAVVDHHNVVEPGYLFEARDAGFDRASASERHHDGVERGLEAQVGAFPSRPERGAFGHGPVSYEAGHGEAAATQTDSSISLPQPDEQYHRPSVSVLIPTLNELSSIDRCLSSVLDQGYPLHEVLVLDGGSTDGTREKVAEYGPPIRLVHNPGRGPAAAMNEGIALSSGEVICRLDAHAEFAPDYVARCVEVLLETGADVVGGPMRPKGTGAFGQAVAAVTSSSVAMPGRFHFATERAEVDTVYLGAWLRTTLVNFGGFDADHFPWCGEDNELNYRIRRAGGRVVLDPTLRSRYFPRESPGALWRQYERYGIAKASSIAKHGGLPSWRPLAPAALIAAAFVGIAAGRTRASRFAVPLMHGVGCLFVGVFVSRRGGTDPWRAAAVQEICHWSFGLGFWFGLWQWLRGRPVQVPQWADSFSTSFAPDANGCPRRGMAGD